MQSTRRDRSALPSWAQDGGTGQSAFLRRQASQQNSQREKQERVAREQNQSDKQQFAALNKRGWQVGDVYSPRDLGAHQMRRAMKGNKKNRDVIDELGVDPLDMYKVRSVWASSMLFGSGSVGLGWPCSDGWVGS